MNLFLLQRSQHEALELDFDSFRLQGDLAFRSGAVGPVIDHVAVDPDLEVVAQALDDHLVPFPDRLFAAVGEIQNAPDHKASDWRGPGAKKARE